jgi:MFS family permease
VRFLTNAVGTLWERLTGLPAEDTHGRATVGAAFMVLTVQGYAYSLLGVDAPFIAKDFGLNQSGIAGMYAWISLNALGALVLSRFADRIGRRVIMLLCLTITPLCSIGAAISYKATWFIVFEIAAYAAIGASIASSIVILAEALPIERRSRGQGLANFAIGVGGGFGIFFTPLFIGLGLSWRWLFVIAGVGILIVPTMIRAIPESHRWEHAAASGATERTRFYDVFGPAYRRRAIPLIVATLIGEVSGAAVPTWIYYHAVAVVGLTPAKGSMILIIGGGIAVLGLALGVWLSERIGRIRTIVSLGLAGIVGVLAFYWGPPKGFAWPTLWLILAHTWFATTGRGLMVAANSAVTELFPTALRGTIVGWMLLCIALSAIGGQATISILAGPFGGLSNVVGWLSLLTIPSVLIWGIFMPETRGLSLEAAAQESVPEENVLR